MAYQSKTELVKKLVEEYDYSEKDAQALSREELVKLMDNLDNELDATPVEDNSVNEKWAKVYEQSGVSTDETVMGRRPQDVDWHDYVMSHFQKDELQNGCPTVDGMRRVSEIVVGEILKIDSSVRDTPKEENQYRAVVICRVAFEVGEIVKEFSGCADAFSGNAEPEFARHATALAETRAEGRALKRALRLKKIVSAEEMIADESKIEQPGQQNDKYINGQQINFIDVVGKKSDVNLAEFVRESVGDNTPLKLIPYDKGVELCNKIAEFKNKPENIPENMLGYKAGWQN